MKHSTAQTTTRNLNPIEQLNRDMQSGMARVNQTIEHYVGSDVTLIPEIAAYLVDSGGKRVRPLLTLACADLLSYDGSEIPALAAAVEFIHTATLLHDDVVDESPLRRGKKAANLVYGNKTAVLVGDFLFSRAFQLMVTSGSLDVLRILSDASAVIAEGEVMQLSTERQPDTTQDRYLQVIAAKTASLFAASCEVSAAAAKRPKTEQQALQDYGMAIGMAFQIVDDILDYSAVQNKLGKKTGDDLREGKMTLPVIMALAHANDMADETAQQFWQNILSKPIEQSDFEMHFTQACTYIEQADALRLSMNLAKKYIDDGKAALNIFPHDTRKQSLLDIADYIIARDY